MSGYMSKLLGLLLYVINIYFSNGVQGSSVTLTCSISSNNYVWHKYQKSPEKWIQLTNDGKYANINKKQMTIENVSVADSIEYLCVGDGKTDKTLLNVTVVSRKGTSFQLSWPFEITNYLWQRFTQNVWSTLLNNDGKYANVNTLQLTIYNVDAYDSGQYRCTNLVFAERITSIHLHVIVNGGWSDWSDWTCSVTCGDGAYTRHRSCINPAPANGGSNCFGLSYETGSSCNIGPCEAIPSIEISQPSYNGGIGGNITLECKIVNSYPSVQNLWWTHDDLKIPNSGRYSGSTISNPSLTITGVIASDSGYYYCFANNAVGSSNASTKLSTGNFPKVEIVIDRYVSTKGTNVTIECNVKYGDTITWYKDNAIWQQNNTYYLGKLNRSYLVINDVKPTDRGVYKCYVTNNYGSQSDETSLKVVQTEILNSSYVMTANESVDLNCAIYDATEVKWRKDDVNILIDSGRYSGGNTTVPSLTITKLNRGDSGIYHCESLYDSMSSIGNGIMLRIRDKPLVTSPEENVIAYIGKDTIIGCSFDSYPKPTGVSWIKDGNILNVEDVAKYNGSTVQIPSLNIYNVDYADSGTYICSVENLIGKSSGKSLKLLVQVADPLKSPSIEGPVAGGVSGGIVAVGFIIVAVFIYAKRRNTPRTMKDRRGNKKIHQDESSHRHEAKTDGMYINIGHENLVSARETDDNLRVTSSVHSSDDEKKTYYNVDDVKTAVQVKDFKEYIKSKEKNDGLKEDYKKIPYGILHPTTKAELKENMPKNRFKTTFPYDHTRVTLETVHGIANSDYVNANYVDGFCKEKCYIASQGPLKQTMQDHWRMIWQNNTRKIVMLTNLIEGLKTKCERYWPIGGEHMRLDNMVLTLENEKERAAYITREISIENKKTNEKRYVIQYHFTAWPDHGTPDPLYIVLFHKHFMNDHNKVQGGPVLVHCSAGIGRTGTFIALDALLEEGRSTGNVDIVKFVKKMRYSRMNMIQTADQYVCLHHALLEAFTMEDTSISKEKFGPFWREIQSDKRPVNQQKLNEEFRKLNIKKSEHGDHECKDATNTENIDKNRNKCVLPMDNNRVFLVSFEKGRSNYINAVQVPSYTKFVGYITTQLPLPDTKIDFWTMIRDQHSSTIVLILNDLQEADLVYAVSDDSCTCGPFNVKIKRKENIENNITEATLVMTRKHETPREIALYQTICKDRPNPQDLCRLDNLLSTRISMSSDPVTVVSCDGAKNCGLFCTFINAVSSMQIDAKADVFQLARLLQLRRPEFFSDYEEYRLVYEALNFYLESTNVYAN